MKRAALGMGLVIGMAVQLCSAQAPQPNRADQDARDVLRQALGQETARPKAPAAQTNTVRQPTLPEMERMYLDGKITAREFQRFLQTHRAQPAPVAARTAPMTNDVHARALAVLHKTSPNAAANPQGPAITEPLPEPVRENVPAASTNETAKAAALQEVESKLDELLRLKQAREQTNATATSTNAPAAPKTKRERLDQALRLYIQGKLSDDEYKERRAKILAEPD